MTSWSKVGWKIVGKGIARKILFAECKVILAAPNNHRLTLEPATV